MQKFEVTLHVFIKPAVLNPAEGPVKKELHELGFSTVSKIQMGKVFVLSLQAENQAEAEELVGKMAQRLLINPVTESFVVVSSQSSRVTKSSPAA